MGVALMRSVAPAIQTAEERGAALMKRVEYRLMESSADREAIYRLRYNAYLKEGAINPNPSGLLIDRFEASGIGKRFHGHSARMADDGAQCE